MSISNLPGNSGLDIIASASASALSVGNQPVTGLDDITFTSKTGSYKATWDNLGVIAGPAAVDLAIVIPWTNAELDERGITVSVIGPADSGKDLEFRRILSITAPTADTSRILVKLVSAAGTADGDSTTIRFSIC